ncbi:MAG: hypothetical protein A2725_00435 [Candidatus Magasanikbacteria bacterium RIFCSPHIGHO2_01_FULL_33_34]|uniref:Uncharacterized protein n=1 Tax=Candidatus Magasanikbacteria bacterium RIFCSPHIGHO2_01_FULL_33_34 TaxID=1798671 RepID=A0A1F6LL40_9BACT|nr:MAG: hypothetical protein A2725_00435 [Candidatus Magasanikbacteria bacterium RIFCSPHIGHO2_01_FULL_33_34]OGH65827.1 MAG: hypothetical protein A3B83_03105 [Candidatus Magasanikbacteria bacterium RIFCSPHIGHO2_02_FULL_33_17]OGH75192.1 MAG: hypothetical protein A3A89_03700 [Candidatus Magasanikbacteria bacterium RIFCSPLOWO2_01_FULL_33_34]
MTMASIGQKIISFVYFMLIANHIGAESTGKYFFALAFTTVFVVFVDLGLTSVLVRESAKHREKIQSYFSTILSVKIILGIVTYIAAIVTINLMGYPEETRYLVYLSGVTMLFDSLHLTLYGVLRAVGNLKYEAMGIVASQLITLGFGTTFLYLNFPLIYLILAFTISSFLNVVYVTVILYKKYKINLTPHYDKKVFMYVAKIALPFAFAAVFARVYSYIDSILLSKLAGDVQVGLYSIPYKITYAFQFFPLALMAVLYPRFSEYFVSNKNKLAFVFERGVKYLLIIVMPITFGIGVLSQDIITTLFNPEYANSVLPLQILLAGLIFSYISFPIGGFLNACNRQVTQTIIVGSVMFVNIGLNILLIPKYGVVGASLTALFGNFLLTILGYIFVPSITKISHLFILKSIFQIVISGLVMAIVVWSANLYYHFIFAIIVGALVYTMMLFMTGAITRKQVKEAILMVRN